MNPLRWLRLAWHRWGSRPTVEERLAAEWREAQRAIWPLPSDQCTTCGEPMTAPPCCKTAGGRGGHTFRGRVVRATR